MNKSELRYQMWGLVPYNISSMQKGAQFTHAVVEYCLENFEREEFQKWARYDKTVIIKDGGTTNTSTSAPGTLNQHMLYLHEMGVDYATFYEPDLGDQLLGIAFLVDEYVWDDKTYPSPEIEPMTIHTPLTSKPSPAYQEAIDRMGGQRNWELRQFLKQFRFAS